MAPNESEKSTGKKNLLPIVFHLYVTHRVLKIIRFLSSYSCVGLYVGRLASGYVSSGYRVSVFPGWLASGYPTIGYVSRWVVQHECLHG